MTISNLLKEHTGKFEQESISIPVHGFSGRYRHWWSHDHILIHSEVKVTQSCPNLHDPMDCRPPGTSVYGDPPGKNTGVGCHVLLQGIFPTQGWNPCLLHWQVGSLSTEPSGLLGPVYFCGRNLFNSGYFIII